MRLSEIRIEKYAVFEDVTLPLDPRPGCLNLITAPNGAGKSVLRRAFGDLLFGIHPRSPMNFRYGYAEMRISARAALADGTALAFSRRKGQGNTLLDETGAPLLPARLGMLPDSDIFQRLFALDTALLRAGGNELLAADGDIGSLLLAAAGFGNARALAKALDKESGDITFVRRDAKSPFNIATTDLKEARRRADTALVRPRDWEKQEAAYRESLARQEAARARAVQAQAALDKLARIRALREPLRQHDAAAAWLSANQDAPRLPGDLRARLDKATRDVAQAASLSQAADLSLADLQARLAAIIVQGGVLSAQDAITALDGPAGAVTQALSDLPVLRGKHAAATAEIRQILRDMGADCAPEAASALLADGATREAADMLIRAHAALANAASSAARQFEKTLAEIARNAEDLAGLPPDAELPALAPLLREIRAEGDPAKRAEQAARDFAVAEASLARALAQTPFWQGDAAALAALRLWPQSSYAQAHATLQAAQTRLQRQQENTATQRARHAEAAAALTAATAQTPIADRAAIAAARAHRDAGWRLVTRLAFGGAPLTAEEQLGFAGTEHLALAYERSVAEADRLADLREDASDAVARAVAARATAATEAVALAKADNLLTEAADAAGAANAAWRALLPAELPPSTTHDGLREFIAARDEVLRGLQARSVAADSLRIRQEEHASWAARLRALLNHTETSLPALLLSADAIGEQAARTGKSRAALAAQAQVLQNQHHDAQTQAARAAAALADWQTQWDGIAAQLGRPAGEKPELTAMILKRQHALAEALAEAERQRERLDQIAAHAANFTRNVRQTLHAAGLTMPAEAVEQALAATQALKEKLRDARAAQAQRGTLLQQQDKAVQARADLRAAAARHQGALDLLLTEAGAPDVQGARLRLDLAEARAAHEAALQQAEKTIATHGDGRTLDALRAAIADIAQEDMAAAEARARDDAAATGSAREEIAAEVQRLRGKLDEEAASTAYAEAIAQQNDAAARASAALADALLLRLSSLLLTEALGRFAADSQPDQLRRIAAWFARLTRDAYPDIGIDRDSEPPKLTLHQAGRPHETRHVEDLSEGTRDQLFLALRLAAIQTHPARLPFVADDILQSFDDPRAEAALHALLALSDHVQVILLTHHDHIGGLANALPCGSVHRVSLPAS